MLGDRLSIVNNLNLNALFFASVIHIGDSDLCCPKCRAFSLQRELPIFRNNEASFFKNTWARLPVVPSPAEEVVTSSTSLAPIMVNNLKITSCSSSAVVHIGSTHEAKLEAELKHIRNFL